MKRIGLVVSITFISLLGIGSAGNHVAAQVTTKSEVTLYSPIKHSGEQLRGCVNFQVRASTRGRFDPCDLRYGNLYVGDQRDWFEAISNGKRTVVKDLGEHSWDDQITVPEVEPLPQLKPGERRQVTIDASGADGAPGANGARGANGANGSNGAPGSGNVSDPEFFDTIRNTHEGQEPGDIPGAPLVIPEASRPLGKRHDGKPKIDPLFTKALAGHLYVVHVVDEVSDFYALFHVDGLVPGDSCTISWRLIPRPVSPVANE